MVSITGKQGRRGASSGLGQALFQGGRGWAERVAYFVAIFLTMAITSLRSLSFRLLE
jgi:hypothetical protein